MKTKFFYQECIRSFGAKAVAQILGVSEATVYKYSEGKEFETDSGCKNPIDYLLKLRDYATETGNHRISSILNELLCERGHITHVDPTLDVITDFSEAYARLLVTYADSYKDKVINHVEARRILDQTGTVRVCLDTVEAIAKEVLR